MQNSDEQTKGSLLDGWNAPPNLVTYVRIALVVVFLILDVMAGPYGVDDPVLRWVAAVIFIIAASTDKIDGWMARKYNQVTEMGKLMDPIADKLLTCGALIAAAAFGEFGNYVWGWVLVALFLIRELGITVMRFFVLERPGGKVIAATWPGKLKTVFQCVGLSLLLIPLWTLAPGSGPNPWWLTAYTWLTQIVIYVALALCLYSGAIYLINTFRRPSA